MTPPAHPKHIFVVNNTPVLLDLVRTLLEEERYRITTTNFLPKTFDQIADLQPSLLIIDLCIGAQDGWQLLAEVRQEASTHGIPVLVFSATQSLLEQAAANHALWGGDRFLSVPFELDELVLQIRGLIGVA